MYKLLQPSFSSLFIPPTYYFLIHQPTARTYIQLITYIYKPFFTAFTFKLIISFHSHFSFYLFLSIKKDVAKTTPQLIYYFRFHSIKNIIIPNVWGGMEHSVMTWGQNILYISLRLRRCLTAYLLHKYLLFNFNFADATLKLKIFSFIYFVPVLLFYLYNRFYSKSGTFVLLSI